MHNHQVIINKLDKLSEMVIFKIADYKKHPDYIWCERTLSDVRDSGLVPSKIEFTMANLIWKKYSGGVSVDEKTIWLLIDTLIEEGSKIGAIKMYRRFINSSLREAKEVIDARQISKEKEWTK